MGEQSMTDEWGCVGVKGSNIEPSCFSYVNTLLDVDRSTPIYRLPPLIIHQKI